MFGIDPEKYERLLEDQKQLEDERKKDQNLLVLISDSLGEVKERIQQLLEDKNKSIQEKQAEIRKLQDQLKRAEKQLLEEKKAIQNKAKEAIEKRNQMIAELLSVVAGLEMRLKILLAPPRIYGVFIRVNKKLNESDPETIDVSFRGERLAVSIDSELKLDPNSLKPGQRLLLSSKTNNVIGVLDEYEDIGAEVTVDDLILGSDRVRVVDRLDEKRIVRLAGNLSKDNIRIGDKLLMDSRSGFVLEKLPKGEVQELILEEVPDVTFDQIGGLEEAIEQVSDAIYLPFGDPVRFRERFKLIPAKGLLFYGPPGCGKTLLGKAIANSLAKEVAEYSGLQKLSLANFDGKEMKGYFLNIKGPEILSKWVGEAERKIREAFQLAREKAKEGHVVVLFFDEIDSILRVRGAGISQDLEITLVPTFSTELDGIEPLSNVIVIGATNRPDLLDPAILRPGRIDVKVKIGRPNEEGTKDIFKIYLTPDLPFAKKYLQDEYRPMVGKTGKPRLGRDGKPLCFKIDKDPKNIVNMLSLRATDVIFNENDPANRYIEITYFSGRKEILHFRDFVSGAIIANIVRRAKLKAFKAELAKGKNSGIEFKHLFEAIREEFKESEDLPNTTNPEEWARVLGKRIEDPIKHIRSLLSEK